MVSSGFGPYHGLWLEDAPTKCIGVTPTPWVMTITLGLVRIPPQQEQLAPSHRAKNVTVEILMMMHTNVNNKLIFCYYINI